MAAAEVTVMEPALESGKIQEVRTDLLPVAMEVDEKTSSEKRIVAPDPGPPRSTSPSPSAAVVNGDNFEEEEDDNNNDDLDLTPPPDTPPGTSDNGPVDMAAPVEEKHPDNSTKPSEEPLSGPPKISPSPPINSLEDEIVVGANNRRKPSPNRAASELEDAEMEDAGEQPHTGQHSTKRKRASQPVFAAPDRPESPPYQEEPEVRRRGGGRPKTHGMGAVKGVILGYWRDSLPEDPEDKHSVTGFIDVRDRLRTRVQPTTRAGKDITRQYPLPPGPGGSWVTFERIAFDPHLVNLDHNQVKEYVKIRAETTSPNETSEEKARLDAEAVKQAIENVEKNPPPENSVPVAIAYGPDIPEHVVSTRSNKKPRVNPGSATSSPAPGAMLPAAHQQSFDGLLGHRPTRILLGFWKKSSEEDDTDKHAVYGIIGANDMFRVKLMRETRDGRRCDGNFPVGAGQLWIQWDEVAFEPHLASLSRPEIKEYCRARQAQIDNGETPEDRASNEIKAVAIGRMRAAAVFSSNAQGTPTHTPGATAQRREDSTNAYSPLGRNGSPVATRQNGSEPTPEDGLMSGVQGGQRRESLTRGRLPQVELREANRPRPQIDPIERTHALARRELERAENAQNRRDQFAAEREAASTVNSRAVFQDNVSRLNKVWAAQEANRLRAGAEDAKIYGGIKYERKTNGPFQGKLVSQGAIITIDGEDYVEYRVLTKPTFF